MIGDPYFQLRAQIGTALFSLLRLAAEAGASAATQTALKTAHAGLREPLLFLALGPAGGGKSTLLNTLFEREFCGPAEPHVAGKVAVFLHGAEPRDTVMSATAVECQRPHIFLRDFAVIDTPGLGPDGALPGDLALFLPRADVIFFVVSAAVALVGARELLPRLDREVLRRTLFIVWQSDRVSPDEGATAVKRLRQAMLKNLGHACPIFAASQKDHVGRDKLVRWIESEIVFSAPRRARLEEIDRLAHETLREIAGKPFAAEQAWQRADGQLRQVREDLAEREEQSQRQIAGVLWTLAQSFDALRQRGEAQLRPRLLLADFFRARGEWRTQFAREIESEARAALGGQANEALVELETDLQHATAEYLQDCRETLGEKISGEPPQFPRAEIAGIIQRLEAPLALEHVLSEATDRAARLLRLPLLATVGAAAITLGAWPVVGWVAGSAMLAAGTAAFTLVLALLLRADIVAAFGHEFTANRTALLGAVEAPLREASVRFYAALAQPLDARIATHSAEHERHESLLSGVQQIEETFARIAQDLRAERAPSPPPAEVS